MICPTCKVEGPFEKNACVNCGARVGPACPKCRNLSTPGEKFCALCGTEIKSTVEQARDRSERADRQAKLGSARKWLMAVSILTFVSGIAFYFLQSGEVERQIREAEKKMVGMSPEERDERFKDAIGMTWAQAVAQDRGQVRLLLFVNLGLAVVYLGLWFWAARNAFAASLVALILFGTVILVSAILEPKSLAQGWLVKIFFTAALFKAVSAGYHERKLSGARS